MSNKFSATMFDKLKESMANQRSSGNFKDILKTAIGNNYVVRLIPNVDDISKTIYHYYSHGWQSLATGQFVSCVCPGTYGDRCPICEERVRLYRGDDEDKVNAKLLGRKEQWLTNVYVVKDPINSENNGVIKVIRYGKQLDKIIHDATQGVDKDEFGSRIFDLTDEGCNLRIAVEKNDGGYPTYVSSKFLRESKIDGLNTAKLDKLYESLFELEHIFESKSGNEVKDLLDTHFFCEVTVKVTSNTAGTHVNSSGDVKTLSNESTESKSINKTVETEQCSDSSIDNSLEDKEVQDKLDDLMKDL